MPWEKELRDRHPSLFQTLLQMDLLTGNWASAWGLELARKAPCFSVYSLSLGDLCLNVIFNPSVLV